MENDVPYIVFEGEQARNERHIKRLWIALIILITLLFASNAIWLYAWTLYDYDTVTYTQDGEGLNNINTGMQEDVVYGSDVADSNT